MGKKKHKKHKHAKAEAAAPFNVPPQVAGIALAALKQVETPAFQKLVAGALGAAAQAFAPKRPDAPADPPPVPPAPAMAAPTALAPDAGPSPEVSQAIDQAAAHAAKALESAAALASRAIGTASVALERWAAEQAQRSAAGDRSPGAD